MPFDEKSARELEQWRTKYYDSLQQLEHKEREWRRTDNVLRQCISRLTLLADGTDRDLERQLERLREGIRGHMGGAQLEGMIQSLSQQLAKLDEQHRVQAVPPNPFDVLRQLADGISFPRGFGHKAKAYARNLSGQRPDADYSQPLRELVSLIGEALEWGASHEPEPEEAGGKGLLSKLFKRSEEAPSAAAVADVPAPIVQPPPAARAEHHDLDLAKGIIGQLVSGVVGPSGSPLGKVAGRLPAIQREDELRRLVDELAALMSLPLAELGSGVPAMTAQEVLLRLLERLGVPIELHDRVETIKATLADPLQEGELERVLSDIAELITLMRARVQSEKVEIESFLKQLTENLRELDINLQSAVSAHRETVRDGRELDTQVQVQVKGIEASVQQAQDLHQLKAVVQERVDTIRRHMDVFRHTEDERIERAEREVQKLSERLRDVEGEADALRSRVQKERNQALIDPLTEIFNRLAYNERIAQEFTRWKRYPAPFAFTVWDVDNFKKINDTYGHQAGDKVLHVVAKLLAAQIRESDFVARYGGEEFVILLPETNMDNARIAVEKIRAAIEQCEFHYRGSRVLITISCGLAGFRSGDDPDQVFARADAALYRAKAQGRNRCVADGDR